MIHKTGFKYYVIKEIPYYLNLFFKSFSFNIFTDLFIILPVFLKEKSNLIVMSEGGLGYFLNFILLPLNVLAIIHGYYPLERQNFIVKWILNKYLDENKIFLNVSEFSKNNVFKFMVSPKNKNSVQVIYNYVGSLNDKLIRQNSKKIQILTLGTLTWYKNPQLWVKVAKQVIDKFKEQDIEFIWAGEGELLEKCLDLISGPQYFNIKFIGHQNDVDKLYSLCTIYFQPSALENFGLAIADAMRWGVPCVVSASGGPSELVVDGETGFVINSNDVNSMVEKIILLLADEHLREQMGKAGRLRYEMNFTIEIWEEKMLKLHKSFTHDSKSEEM